MERIIPLRSVSLLRPARVRSFDDAADSARGVFIETDRAESILEAWRAGKISLQLARNLLDYEENRTNAGGIR